MREDLAVEVKRDRLLIRRGEVEVVVLPDEIRHLVNALAEAAGRLVDLKAQEDSIRGGLRWRPSAQLGSSLNLAAAPTHRRAARNLRPILL